jgi:hypothetical protein
LKRSAPAVCFFACSSGRDRDSEWHKKKPPCGGDAIALYLLEVELYAFAGNSAQFYLRPPEFDVDLAGC